MKLNDDTTIKTLRELIGQKIMTRTSRSPIKVTGIEITGDEAWFVGLEGSKKRRIKLQYISEIWAEDDDESSKQKKRPKTPQELKEARLKKAEEAEAKKSIKDKRTEWRANWVPPEEEFPNGWL